jgi:hypothetical protein
VEFEDNLKKTLSQLGVNNSARLTVTNDYDDCPEKNVSLTFFVSKTPESGSRIVLHGPRSFKPRPMPLIENADQDSVEEVVSLVPILSEKALGKRPLEVATEPDAKKSKNEVVLLDD